MTRRHQPADAAIDLVATRMRSLLLSGPERRSIDAIVEWFGALQGQDLASVSWSLGLRSEQRATQVAAAFASGSIVRTWPMRGTLHVVPARDAGWMVKHLGARALAAAQRRRAVMGLGEQHAERAAAALAEALADGPLTRAECSAVMRSAGVDPAGQRTYHLLWYTCQRGLACVGPDRDGEQTFVSMDPLTPDSRDLDRGQALACVAERFVRSHGPVSDHDLARWADLTLADARAGIASVPSLVRRTIAGRSLVLTEEALDADVAAARDAVALPGFDELVLGYKDRTAQLAPEHERLIVPGGNGVFAPTLVVGGRVRGTWRRRVLANRVVLSATAFTPLSRADEAGCEQSLAAFGRYVDREPEIRWSPPR